MRREHAHLPQQVIAWEANPFTTKTFRRLVQSVLQPAEPDEPSLVMQEHRPACLNLLQQAARVTQKSNLGKLRGFAFPVRKRLAVTLAHRSFNY
jgi:hypothetical protein